MSGNGKTRANYDKQQNGFPQGDSSFKTFYQLMDTIIMTTN